MKTVQYELEQYLTFKQICKLVMRFNDFEVDYYCCDENSNNLSLGKGKETIKFNDEMIRISTNDVKDAYVYYDMIIDCIQRGE